MISTYTFKTVPFRIMRPTLATLMGAALLVFGQVEVDDKLATKLFLLRDATNKLDNPTRNQIQTRLAAWYGVSLELADATEAVNPQLAGLLRNVCKEADWIEPAWVYMQERMVEWTAANTEVKQ